MDRLGAQAVRLHTVMLNDRRRTERFIAAVRQVVRPGDVVVDLGTGTGVLAIAAARAGARRVYAIESGAVRRVAERMARANGVADRVTVVAGHSTKVDLPERADVLVTETFGNAPLAERVLQSVADARRRLLKPDARVVPGALRIYALPVTFPERFARRHLPTAGSVARWRSWYGIDFAPLAAVNEQVLLAFLAAPRELRDAAPLTDPILLADLDLAAQADGEVRTEAAGPVLRAGELSGLIIYFDLRLTPELAISTRPDAAADNHWLNPVYLLAHPFRVPHRGVLRLTYAYNGRRNTERIHVSHEDV